MEYQQKLIGIIRNKIRKNDSLTDVIATVLNISYDAAHRRIAAKSKFSMEEAIQLCLHFGISMDSLFSGPDKVVAERTKEIRTMDEMALYMADSAERLSAFQYNANARMYYSAKDIPLFHTIGGTLLSKFKLYVWINLLTGAQHEKPFEKFTVATTLLEQSAKLKSVYENVEVHEIWNDTTINSTLQQVYYYFQAGLLSAENAKYIYSDLQDIMNKVEERCCNERSRYRLYYNELLILNNNVLLTAPEKQSLFVPYTMLGYFITSDEATCTNARDFFVQQVKSSKSLNDSGLRDRKLFFNKARQKVTLYIGKLEQDMALEL